MFELPNANKDGKTLPSGFKIPKGMKPLKGTMPEGFKPYIPEEGFYSVEDKCDNCEKSIIVAIPNGIDKMNGLKNQPCPKCGCKIIVTDILGRMKKCRRERMRCRY